ncbi:MAG TPA: hypothetical protein PK640_09445 [Verrucomicrobiota bacterium]|nr:hypothetical protein [Verrucomicrobiota bacterium]
MWHARPACEDMMDLRVRDTKPACTIRNPVWIVLVDSFTIEWKSA